MSVQQDLMTSGQAFGNAARQLISQPNSDNMQAAQDAVLAIVNIGDEIFSGALDGIGANLDTVHQALDAGFHVLNGVAHSRIQGLAAEVDEYMAFFAPK